MNWDVLVLGAKAAVLLITIHTLYWIVMVLVKCRKDLDHFVCITAGCTVGILILGIIMMIGIFIVV